MNLPFLFKGIYHFDDETGQVWREHPEKPEELIGPLRQGLSGYLWLLTTSGKFMRRVKP